MKYLKLLVAIAITTTSYSASAIIITGAKIENLYVQSLNGPHKSDAHALRIDKPIDNSCHHRMYINPLDKELFSTLLAYKASGTSFNLMYEIGKPKQLVAGHVESTCKIYSIW
ncbi:exported hypothetical protein [Vibrio nigripulchritudo SO65]|uniref:hypothetical protein n=1 Tax=Vibrio nigripulchritudo TaxID=28173 RepID=UPI0003B202DF|nr:hypothetical protein [Vibrio nigripulchritudo]CCN33703.1 exported hypothetical protein [Vibrio nigripulchritudo AM115]CCN41907.1 exported hypothetical protein [Vibrio nigripulchritudo FTn2]CCN66300.1 exported hypothetical protein [Vibrio nigripulchritudo POn4]CCN74657.1 exported hypothetical protein [Vibrio nigripulchritudo SO65]